MNIENLASFHLGENQSKIKLYEKFLSVRGIGYLSGL
jgi:hypothetical protein